MRKCVAADLWPASSDEVLEDDFDAFVAHAKDCPYHEAQLRACEEPLRAVALRARSLLASGHPPPAPAAWHAPDDLDGRYKRWEATRKTVRSLALRHRGQEVARHEWFEKVNVCVERELDTTAAIQVWKLADDENDEDVLLGVYLLDEYKHDGRLQELELPTGQIVILSVRRLKDRRYEIKMQFASRRAMVADAGGSSQAVTQVLPVCVAFLISFAAAAGLIYLDQRLDAAGHAKVRRDSARSIKHPAVAAVVHPAGGFVGATPRGASNVLGLPAGGEQQAHQGGASLVNARADVRRAEVSAAKAARPVNASNSSSRVITLSTNGLYQLPAPDGPQTVLVRAGDNEPLLEEFALELGRQIRPGALSEAEDAAVPNRVMSLRLDWQAESGKLMAHVGDPNGQTIRTITCRSDAQSPERARTQAVRGVVIELLDYFQSPGAEAGVTTAEAARPAQVETPREGALEDGPDE